MGEENQEVEQTEVVEETAPTTSNSDIKNSDLFQKVTSELAELRKEKSDRQAAEEAARQKQEQDALVAKGDFEAALKSKADEIESLQTKFKTELLQRDLKGELFKVGFTNDLFVNGAVQNFMGDASEIGEYVSGLAGNEANKSFLTNAQRNTLPAPVGAGNVATDMTIEQAKDLRFTSKDPEIKKRAFEVCDAYYDKHHTL